MDKARRAAEHVVSVLLTLAVGVVGNKIFDNFGVVAAGVLVAVAGVVAAGMRLHRLPPRAPLVRYTSRGLLVCGFAVAVIAAFGPRHLGVYAASTAAVLTMGAVLTTPGIGVISTLFRVAWIGLGVAMTGDFIAKWPKHAGPGDTIMGVMLLGVLGGFFIVVYLLARFLASDIISGVEAREGSELSMGCFAVGALLGFGSVMVVGSERLMAAALAVNSLAALSLGIALYKGGRNRVAAAISGCGLAMLFFGLVGGPWPGALLLKVSLVGAGSAMVGFGLDRLDAPRRLRAWWQYLTGTPDELGRTEPPARP